VSSLTAALKNPLELIWVPTLVLGVCGFFLLLFNAVLHQDEFGLQMTYIVAAFFLYIIGVIRAIGYRDAST